MALLGSFGLALGIVLLSVLLLVPFDSGVIVGDFQAEKYVRKLNPFDESVASSIVVEDYFFSSQGEKCHAWLYYSKEQEEILEGDETTKVMTSNKKKSVIVMAQGLGGQKDFGLDRYAVTFVQEGFAVFMFDYRNFGASEGVPRNWVSPKRHIEDYHAALDFIESSSSPPSDAELSQKVDNSKIFLWGTSFSGGHVLEIASQRREDANIKGVVSQIPHLSGRAAALKNIKTRGLFKMARVALAALQDVARNFVGLSPVAVNIIGTGNAPSIMGVDPDDLARYKEKQPAQKLGRWLNQAPARILLEIRFYNPLDTLAKQQIKVPVLFVGATLDDLCPPEIIQTASSLVPGSKLIIRDGTHFSIYEPEHSIPLAAEMSEFYKSCIT